MYFRSFMDEEGYIPLVYLFNYPHIGSIGADYYSVLEALSDHQLLEANPENETIRLKNGWDMVCRLLCRFFSCLCDMIVSYVVADSKSRRHEGCA